MHSGVCDASNDFVDLKFGEMVVSDGVSVQAAPTAPHSFSRLAETYEKNTHS